MIPVRMALLGFGLCCWDAWRLLAGRIGDATGTLLVMALAAALFGAAARARPTTMVSVAGISVLLVGYAVATVTGPALLQIGLAVTGMVLIARRALADLLPRLPLVGLAILVLPILPTLDFLLAWPMRRFCALVTAGLLRMNGFAVGVDGVALYWQGRLLLFDAACSGIRMLWASLLIAHILALLGRFNLLHYARAVVVAMVCAVAGNILRATSLFYLENGFVAPLQGPIAHEAVGVAAFILLGLVLILVLRPRGEMPA